MSKLLKLKEWLTVKEAAKRLTISVGEKIKEADVLRLALDGHLTLSVSFVNHARAKMGKFVPFSESKWTFMPPLAEFEWHKKHYLTAENIGNYPESLQAAWLSSPPELREKCLPIPLGYGTEDGKYIELGERVITLDGVWDLLMIGSERIDVEHTYQRLTNGPEVTLEGIDGAFVASGNSVCQLLQSWEENGYIAGSKAHLERLQNKIVAKSLSQDEADDIMEKYKEARKSFLLEQKGKSELERYFPAGGLPNDCVYVVRTSSLRDFEQKLNEDYQTSEKPLHPSERKSVSQIIAALADMANLDLSVPYKADEALRKSAATAGLELPSSPETLVKYFETATASKAAKS